MTFKDYLKKGLDAGEFTDGPNKDFAQDATIDRKFRDFKNWDELETFLVFHGACSPALRAARKLFKLWEVQHGQKTQW